MLFTSQCPPNSPNLQAYKAVFTSVSPFHQELTLANVTALWVYHYKVEMWRKDFSAVSWNFKPVSEINFLIQFLAEKQQHYCHNEG